MLFDAKILRGTLSHRFPIKLSISFVYESIRNIDEDYCLNVCKFETVKQKSV